MEQAKAAAAQAEQAAAQAAAAASAQAAAAVEAEAARAQAQQAEARARAASVPAPVATLPPTPPEPATSDSDVADRLRSGSYAAVPSSTEYEGFLRKQGGSHTGWKRRWVAYQAPWLRYSKLRGGPWAGEVDLRATKVFLRPDSLSEDPFVFHVASDTRLFFFQATSKAEAEAWVTALSTV